MEYAKFWKAMFLRDVQEMKRICETWGINYKESFASAQMMRPYRETKGAFQKVSDAGNASNLLRCSGYAT